MLITIHDEKTSAVIDTLGAQLISLKDETGKEYIWQRDPAIWAKCSPLLFPAVGGSRNGKTMFGQTWYEMPKHGFASNMEFTLVSRDETSALFRLTENERTKAHYPFAFVLELSYGLKDGVLSMDYTVSNPQEAELPYCIGAHPGFICPMEEGASFEDYELVFSEKETTKSMVHDGSHAQFDVNKHLLFLNDENRIPLTYEMFSQDAVYFDELKSRSVSLIHKESKKGVQVDFPGFETVAFWTPDGKRAPFLCIEPWNGSAIRSDENDEFLSKHHLQVLKAGESRIHPLAVRILK